MADNDGIKLFEDIYNDIYELKNQVYFFFYSPTSN